VLVSVLVGEEFRHLDIFGTMVSITGDAEVGDGDGDLATVDFKPKPGPRKLNAVRTYFHYKEVSYNCWEFIRNTKRTRSVNIIKVLGRKLFQHRVIPAGVFEKSSSIVTS
jgi:hypothetical protein